MKIKNPINNRYTILCILKLFFGFTSRLLSINYRGRFEGGFAIFDSIRLKLGVSETIPGK